MKTLKPFFSFLIIILFQTQSAWLQPAVIFQWANSAPGTNQDDVINALTTDNSGAVYETGFILAGGAADMDPGPGVVGFTSAGMKDVFIRKLDANGNLVWAKQLGTALEENVYEIQLDPTGNFIYVAGIYSSSGFDADPGAGTAILNFAGGYDIFLIKLNASNGNLVWAKGIGGNSPYESGYSMASDAAGNVYLTGQFGTTVDFDPGAGTANLTSVGTIDAFVLKLDQLGNFTWVKQLMGTGIEVGTSIEFNTNNNQLLLTGNFTNTADFDPNAGTVNLTSVGLQDVFLLRLDANGNYLNAVAFGGTGAENSFGVKCDGSNNIYINGNFESTVDFDPGAGINNLISAGGTDMYTIKFNSSSLFQWVKQVGNAGADYSRGLDVDASGNSYTTGYFQGTVDFDPDAGTSNLIATVGVDAFYTKLDPNGNFIWAYNVGGAGGAIGVAIDCTNTNNLHIGGTFGGTCDFDPNAGVYNLTGTGAQEDIFSLKLKQCVHSQSTQNISACDGYLWAVNSTIYTSSGTYMATVPNSTGCDSTITLNLTINNSSTTNQAITSCASYLWPANGTNYDSSGTYYAFLTNVYGCDSTITLNLTIHPTYAFEDTILACENYTWPVTGSNYTTTGLYTYSGTSSEGCDSTYTLLLTIDNIDSTVTQTGSSFTANQAGASYQWYDCTDVTPIIGATSQTYNATGNGSFKVLVQNGTCSKFSSCFVIANFDIETHSLGIFHVYPNPTIGTVQINSSEPMITIHVVDICGKTVLIENAMNNTSVTLPLETLLNGIYFITIDTSKGKKSVRIVKN